ncbi:MAG: hypothetical protein ACR2GY_09930 [Phycisphaerales bacterium]
MPFHYLHCINLFAPLALSCCLMTMPAFAQAESVPQDAPAENQQAQDGSQDQPPRSIDDLLGIEEDASAESARTAAEAESEAELERALNNEEISDAFRDAIRQMGVSADLLRDQLDPGLGTQRIQEEILRKLDLLIESAQKQSSSSSSSSSSQQQQQQQQQQQPRPQQQNQQQQNQAQNQANQNPTDSSSPRPPDAEATDINSMLAEDQIEWGALPERYRDQLLQAMKDKPSALYKRLTDEYYRRLADEASR